MPLPTKAALPYAKTRDVPLELDFVEVALGNTQARFVGRSVLKPKLNLSEYRFEAVIDWIEFRVTYPQPSTFMKTQSILTRLTKRKCHVRPVQPGAGNESNIFDIRVQEPKSFANILEICHALAYEFEEAAEPVICGLEISLDAYARKPSDEARELMVGVMQRTIFTPRDIWSDKNSHPRSVFGTSNDRATGRPIFCSLINLDKGRYPTRAYLQPESHFCPFVDGTMYLGAQKDEVMIRVQNKTIDTQNRSAGTAKTLPMEETRARIEVTLKGSELAQLGVRTLRSLVDFKFGKLQGRYFQFKLPTFQTTPNPLLPSIITSENERRRSSTFLKSGVVGLLGRDRAFSTYKADMANEVRKYCKVRGKPYGGRRPGIGTAGTFVAYEELNRLVATAFVKLGERESRAQKRLRPAETAGI